MPKRHTDEDKALVYQALLLHDGNARQASNDTGINQHTVVAWRKLWNDGGVPEEITAAIATANGPLAIRLEDLRDKLLDRIKALVMNGEGSLRDLTGAVKTVSDLIAVEKGQATSIKQTQVVLPQLEDVEERIALHVAKMAADAEQRNHEVKDYIDCNIIEEQPKGLPEGAKNG